MIRQISELTIDILDPESQSKILNFPSIKVQFQVEGSTKEDVLNNTDILRKRLTDGVNIYFTEITDQVKTSEK